MSGCVASDMQARVEAKMVSETVQFYGPIGEVILKILPIYFIQNKVYANQGKSVSHLHSTSLVKHDWRFHIEF